MAFRLAGIAAASALLVVAQGAAAHGTHRDRFTHDGTGYNVSVRSNGFEMCLEGRHPETGERFDLHVSRAGRVTGTFEGREVDFDMDRRAARRPRFAS